MKHDESLENSCSLSQHPITELFRRSGADEVLANELFQLVQAYFRRISRAKKRKLGVGDSLPTDQITADSFLRLMRRHPDQWNNREHILRTAALAMEQIVRNHRKRQSTERHGGRAKIVLLSGSDIRDPQAEESDKEVEVHEVLERLSQTDSLGATIVRLKNFGGMTHGQIAMEMELSKDQVQYRYQKSLTWLCREMHHDEC